MKTRLVLTLMLAAALSPAFSAPLSAAPKAPTARALRVNTVECRGWELTRGDSARKMLDRCGEPTLKLSPNVWVYDRFHAVPNHPHARECTSLVVTFIEGVLTDIQLVNPRAQAIITARLQSGVPAVVATAQ